MAKAKNNPAYHANIICGINGLRLIVVSALDAVIVSAASLF
jgi:hypothetical protein